MIDSCCLSITNLYLDAGFLETLLHAGSTHTGLSKYIQHYTGLIRFGVVSSVGFINGMCESVCLCVSMSCRSVPEAGFGWVVGVVFSVHH